MYSSRYCTSRLPGLAWGVGVAVGWISDVRCQIAEFINLECEPSIYDGSYFYDQYKFKKKEVLFLG